METTNTNSTPNRARLTLRHNLGAFEGFNFRDCCAISHCLSAEDVVNWDHDKQGEAEFWPAGDHPGVALVFTSRDAVPEGDLLALDRLLHELGGDHNVNFLRLHYAVNCQGYSLSELTAQQVDEQPLHIFQGESFLDLRREAAHELFALYFPEQYEAWEDIHCDGIIFDEDRFLDSGAWHLEEATLGDAKALIVAGQ